MEHEKSNLMQINNINLINKQSKFKVKNNISIIKLVTVTIEENF